MYRHMLKSFYAKEIDFAAYYWSFCSQCCLFTFQTANTSKELILDIKEIDGVKQATFNFVL